MIKMYHVTPYTYYRYIGDTETAGQIRQINGPIAVVGDGRVVVEDGKLVEKGRSKMIHMSKIEVYVDDTWQKVDTGAAN